MSSIRIFLGTGFFQSNFEEIYRLYWEKSTSPETTEIIFDLKIVEWINTEEIAFLFSWIRLLHSTEKRVKVILPYTYNIFAGNYLKGQRELEEVQQFYLIDTEKKIKRRKDRNLFLLSVWGLFSKLGLKDTQFENIIEGYNSKEHSIKEKYSHLVVPYTIINTTKPHTQFENSFDEFESGERIKVSDSIKTPFQIGKDIIQILNNSDCYSPFESKIISNIITKELFLNSLLHSNLSNRYSKPECYFALSLNNKWEFIKSENFINQFLLEKDKDTIDFYKDKKVIQQIIEKKIESDNIVDISKIPLSGYANLNKYKNEFRNISYVEFTFLDFGDGIIRTLENNFQDFISNEQNKDSFNIGKKENQILEYAFYSESSRSKYDTRLENPELWSRGLYFLLDMIKRYKGLLVVRSGKGKVVYDFSDKIIIKEVNGKIKAEIEEVSTSKRAIKYIDDTIDFDGTMVSIVLPEKKKSELSYSPVKISDLDNSYNGFPRVIYAPKTYEYISMLLVYEAVITTIKPSELANERGFESLLYIEFTKKLKSYENKQCLIFIDFEFYPRNNETIHLQKILSYLTNSPYITEKTKAVIINLPNDERKIVGVFKTNLFTVENEPYIFRPIPCINLFDYSKEKSKIESINWIGIKDENDEILLTNLLTGKNDSVKRGWIVAKQKENSKSTIEGNLFAEYDTHIYSIINADDNLIDRYFDAKKDGTKDFLKSLIEDGAYPKNGEKYFLFQTSKGSYQTQYLSLYETLHNKDVAMFLAFQLLLKFVFDNKAKKELKIDKIVTVTVSSQLIGVAIRDLIHNFKVFNHLKPKDGNTIEDCPFLIMLSSYYSFEDEKPFKEINDKKDHIDNVLIVNDVISTGSLIKKLYEKITLEKKANVLGIISLADCRIETISPEEDKSEFDIKNEICYNILGYPNKEIEIRKYKNKEFALSVLEQNIGKLLLEDDYKISRINPLLNTVVELSDDYSEKQRIIYQDPEKDVFPSDEDTTRRKDYNSKYLKMGHFEQNLSHNSYLTNMKKLFAEKEGKDFVVKIKKKLDEEYVNTFLSNKADDTAKLFSIKSIAEKLEYSKFRSDLMHELNILIEQSLLEGTKSVKKEQDYIPDFIFYPIFSGIENYSPEEFNKTFKTPIRNIIGMQRFNTGKGWRFPFPAKRFNNITKGKKVLIFDSGSLTGESLIQMVDSISFLEVSRIDVISVIGRIEDYNREFFSRIKTNKVKPLKDEDRYKDQPKLSKDKINELEKNRLAFANLNIIFGINLHIPVYPSQSVCPYCLELSSLYSFDEQKKLSNFPKGAFDYIDERKREIAKTNINEYESASAPTYVPHLRNSNPNENKEFDLIRIFSIRDKLGKIDSYRFYKQYFDPFDNEILKELTNDLYDNKEVLRKIELILICILHEPKLFGVHKDLLVKIYDRCKLLIEDLVKNPDSLNKLNYEWSKYSIIRLYYLYFEKEFFNLSNLELILNFGIDDSIDVNKGLNYISYLLLSNCQSQNINIKNHTEKSLLTISHKFDDSSVLYFNSNSQIRELIKQLINYLNPSEIVTYSDAFKNLRLFFDVNNPIYNHNIIEDKISYLSVCVKNNAISELGDLILYTNFIVEKIGIGLKEPLNKIFKSEVFKNLPEIESKMLFKGEDSFFKKYENVVYLNDSKKSLKIENDSFEIFEIIKTISDSLEDLQFEYLKKGTPFYNYCKLKYPCDLFDSINDYIKNNPQHSVRIQNKIPQNTIISIHQLYLFYCLDNIVGNIEKHCPNMQVKANFKIININNEQVLSIEQNGKTKPPQLTHKGGLEKYVQPIFESFFGLNSVYVEKDENKDFTIKVKIK